jgi:GxxExxY protein
MATAPKRTSVTQGASNAVITAAMKVHTELGPGLLESANPACLQVELGIAGVRSATQVGLPLVYCPVKLELGYRIDLLAEDLVVVEIKSVEALSFVDHALILSYLRVRDLKVGRLCPSSLPIVLEVTTELAAAEGDDGIASAYRPKHP